MALPSHNRRVVRFADFEVNFESGELRRRGVRLKLPEQAFQVLSLLVEKPGELVTREELQQKLWSEDTFVDFDTGLNSTVKRLRDILGDSADHPRFIETLPRRGYRLMVPVEWDGAKAPAAAPKALSAVWVSIPRRIRMATLAALALGAILGVLLGLNVGG